MKAFWGNIVVEFFDLLMDVAQEGDSDGPVTDHHDKEDRAYPMEHCHCCSQMHGVCANLVCCNKGDFLSNCQDSILQYVCNLL